MGYVKQRAHSVPNAAPATCPNRRKPNWVHGGFTRMTQTPVAGTIARPARSMTKSLGWKGLHLMDRGQIKPGDCVELSVWRQCPECKGLGARIIPQGAVNIVVVPRETCTWCHGFGRQATFIPIDQLANPDSGIDPLALVRAIKDWLDNQPEQTAMESTPSAQPNFYHQAMQDGRMSVQCPRCAGTGVFRAPGLRAPCDKCNGSGKVPALTMVCPKCGGGGGTAPWDPLCNLKCDRCGGSGEVPDIKAENNDA